MEISGARVKYFLTEHYFFDATGPINFVADSNKGISDTEELGILAYVTTSKA